ncbi:MAG: hypothetical protein AAB566_00815 [Patescibacteria group bacterium]
MDSTRTAQTAKNFLAFLSSGYTKMLLEKPYDELFQTELGIKLKRLGLVSKNAMVVVLGLLAFFLEQKLSDDTVLKKMFKEVATDAWPEFSKRLLNGFTDFLVSRSAAASDKEKAVIDQLSQTKSEDLDDLLTGLAQVAKNQCSGSLDRATERIRKSREKLQQKRKRGVL